MTPGSGEVSCLIALMSPLSPISVLTFDGTPTFNLQRKEKRRKGLDVIFTLAG